MWSINLTISWKGTVTENDERSIPKKILHAPCNFMQSVAYSHALHNLKTLFNLSLTYICVMWFLSSFSHHHFTNTVTQHCLIWLRLVLETLSLHFFRWLVSPHYFIAVWYWELSRIYFTCLSMTHYRPVSCFACLHCCYFVTKGRMTSVSDSMWVSHRPCFYGCIF